MDGRMTNLVYRAMIVAFTSTGFTNWLAQHFTIQGNSTFNPYLEFLFFALWVDFFFHLLWLLIHDLFFFISLIIGPAFLLYVLPDLSCISFLDYLDFSGWSVFFCSLCYDPSFLRVSYDTRFSSLTTIVVVYNLILCEESFTCTGENLEPSGRSSVANVVVVILLGMQ